MTLKVEIEDLGFHYGSGGFGLRIPSLALEPGELVACIGKSGCGKTTLLQLIAGTLLPQRGRVRIGGEDLAQLSDAQRRALRIRSMGLVFQELELLEHLSLIENLLLPYYLNPALQLDAAAEERARGWLEELGLDAHAQRRPESLSQGEKQRVAVARALIAQPRLMLADEPTGNLDPQTRQSVLELVLADARERSSTLLFVTHDHTLLEAFDRVIDVSPWASRMAEGSRP